MPDIDPDLLKDLASELLSPDVASESVGEILWDNIDGYEDMTEEEQDALAAELWRYIDTAEITVTWSD